MIQGRMLAVNIVYRALNVAVVFLISILLSRLTGVAGYGLLSLMIANATIFNLFSAFGSDAGIGFHAASGRLSVPKLIGFLFMIVLFQMILLGIIETISWYSSGHFFLFRTSNLAYAWMGPVFLLSISLVEKYSALLNGKQLFTLCNKVLLTANLLMLALFAYWWFGGVERAVPYYVGAFILLNGVQAVFLMIAYHRVSTGSSMPALPDRKDAIRFFSYSLFTVIINSIQFLAYRVDYWILDHYRDDKELGWYSLAVKLSQLFWVLPLLFASMIFPKVAGGGGEFDGSKMRMLIRAMNGLNLLVGILLFFIAPVIIPLLFGKEYSNSVLLFQLLLPGIILFCIATLLAAYFAGQNKLKVNLGGSVICLGVILFLDLLLIPSKGMKGAAIASSVGYGITALYFVVVYCYSQKVAFTTLIIPGVKDKRSLLNLFRDGTLKE